MVYRLGKPETRSNWGYHTLEMFYLPNGDRTRVLIWHNTNKKSGDKCLKKRLIK